MQWYFSWYVNIAMSTKPYTNQKPSDITNTQKLAIFHNCRVILMLKPSNSAVTTIWRLFYQWILCKYDFVPILVVVSNKIHLDINEDSLEVLDAMQPFRTNGHRLPSTF